MKTFAVLSAAALMVLCSGCGNRNALATIEVQNIADFERVNEIAEIQLQEVPQLPASGFVLLNANGEEVPYQITSDNLLIFAADVPAKGSAQYIVVEGKPALVQQLATGRIYPERQDDLMWENELTGYRAYGPATQAKGETLYGYDLWLKRDTDQPIIEGLVQQQFSAENWARIDSLRQAGDNAAADDFEREISYHIDHGNGMDCYAVGPTLGAATTAMLLDGALAYPWCWSETEVLDNGPLRFRARLTYQPMPLGGDTVIEERIITLDAGSHFNRNQVRYLGNTQPRVLVTGIVLHDQDGLQAADEQNSYLAYIDPTQGTDNGELYIGATFIASPDSAGVRQDGNVRHLAAYNSVEGENPLVYYWGFGWNRADVPDWSAWNAMLARQNAIINSPLRAKVKK